MPIGERGGPCVTSWTHPDWFILKDSGWIRDSGHLWSFPICDSHHGKPMKIFQSSNYSTSVASECFQTLEWDKSGLCKSQVSLILVKITVSTGQILYHVRLRDVVDAGHFDGHGHVHRWTCVGGGEGGEVRTQTWPTPPSLFPSTKTLPVLPVLTPSPMCPHSPSPILPHLKHSCSAWRLNMLSGTGFNTHTHISTQQFAIWFAWSVCLWSDARGQKLQGSTVVQSTDAI